MGIEIERKFLVPDTGFLAGVRGEHMVQGYIACTPKATVRVRLTEDCARLTVKGPSKGISRLEFEYRIPREDGERLLAEMHEGFLISKTRYRVAHAGYTWEVDVFDEENAGLVIAELELEREDEAFPRPGWLGTEISTDTRYFNAHLARHPFRSWITRS